MRERPASWWIGPGQGIMAMGRSGVSGTGGPPDAWRPPITSDPLSTSDRSTSTDDRAIVDAVLGGDRDAYRRLVEREAPGLIRACQRILGNQAEAEDAAQEAFVTAYRSLATWRADGPFGAWLARIAMRLALRQAARRRAVGWARPIAELGVDALGAEALGTAQASPAPGPEQAALRAERANATRRALAGLEEP